MNPKELLSEREVHSEYGLSIPWLRKRRRIGDGPVFLKLGKMVKYERAALDSYLAAHVAKARIPKEKQSNPLLLPPMPPAQGDCEYVPIGTSTKACGQQ